MTSPGTNLSEIQHVVVLMLENRSFDHMLGFLYSGSLDVLAGVTVPTSGATGPSAAQPSHLQEIQAELVSRQFPAGRSPATGGAAPATKEELHDYISANG